MSTRERISGELSAVRDRRWRMLVGGQLRDAEDDKTFLDSDPFSTDLLASIPDASTADVDAAVEAAETALVAWRKIPALERAEFVRRFADVVEQNAEELAFLETLDTGSPIATTRQDVKIAVAQIRMYAGFAMQLRGSTYPASTGLHYSIREPQGVVGKIYAYNHPLMFGCRMAAPLVAGDTVVSKPPEAAPLSMLRLGELIAGVFPAGVVNIVVGKGAAVPDRIVRHPGVRRIGFIGSEPTGRAIQRAAAETGVKHVTLELGGKNAMVVFEDADLDKAAVGAVQGMNFTWSGQSCGSNSRLLVHHSVVDDLTTRVATIMRGIRRGDPLDEGTDQGTMINRAQYEKSREYIEIAQSEGARLIVGGTVDATESEGGYFVPATLFADVEPHMRIAQEEVFGPIMSVLTFDAEDEAIQIANGTDYGLTASVWTRNIDRALRMVERLEAGYIWVNHAGSHFPGVPYGGIKRSGVGTKEECLEEVLSYTEEKVINLLYEADTASLPQVSSERTQK